MITEVSKNPPTEAISSTAGKSKKGQTQNKNYDLIVKNYCELQPKFDEVLSAVGDYFELFKNNTNKLEDLWLQLLDYL